eukprot:5905280-Pyramimonas_sp.AAC.1
MSVNLLQRPRSRVRCCPWRAQPAHGKSMQVPPRLTTEPQHSASGHARVALTPAGALAVLSGGVHLLPSS